MPSRLVVYDLKRINPLITHRAGETRVGEVLEFLNPADPLEEQLDQSIAKYVLLGLPEDIGVQGNFGRPGARHAWQACLEAFVNLQDNSRIKAGKVLLLGHLDFSEEMQALSQLTGAPKAEAARTYTEVVDAELTNLVARITAHGKKVILVGGGHNNAYGLLKGFSLGLGTPLNALNVDAHSDFRKREGRHSGNGFSYAWYEGFLRKYFVLGIQEGYTSRKLLKKLNEIPETRYTTYEELFVRNEKGFTYEVAEALSYVRAEPFGMEVDMDVIAHMPSSAASPSGLDLGQVRHVVYQASRNKTCRYLHLAEAAPEEEATESRRLTGRALALLISDFIRK